MQTKKGGAPLESGRPPLMANCSLADRDASGLARADADAVIEIEDEDLSVADLTCARRARDRFDRGFDVLVVHGDLEFRLLEEAAGFLVAPVDLGDSLLAAASHDAGHGDQVNLF